MKIGIFQKGFNYSQDGFGNRLVYHLQGCNLFCPWCSNPEGIPLMSIIKTDEKRLNSAFNEFETSEIVDEAIRCSAMFFDNGGVTLSGGEPTIQFEAVQELLRMLKQKDIHTAIETNGTCDKLPILFPFVDQLMMDFKHYDSEKHEAFTGIGNQIIKENIKKSAELKKTIFIRIPLINNFNASKNDILMFIKFFKSIDTTNLSVEFLSYHEFGKDKWKQSGLAYTMEDAFVSEDSINEFAKAFRLKGIHVIKT